MIFLTVYIFLKTLPFLIILKNFSGYLKHRRSDTIKLEKILFVSFITFCVKFLVFFKNIASNYKTFKKISLNFFGVCKILEISPSFYYVFYINLFLCNRELVFLLFSSLMCLLNYFESLNFYKFVYSAVFVVVFDFLGNKIFYNNLSDWYDYKSTNTVNKARVL